MSYLIAFAGSNSSTSINFELVRYTGGLIPDKEIRVLDMAKMPFPLYSKDHEDAQGYSNSLIELMEDIKGSSGLLLSVNEHNGMPSAFFKNVMDWLSRIDIKFLEETPVFLMSTSPGRRGAQTSLALSKDMLQRFGATVISTFSLPSFNHNFDKQNGITDQELQLQHQQALGKFLSEL